jgi:hypothetical protein
VCRPQPGLGDAMQLVARLGQFRALKFELPALRGEFGPLKVGREYQTEQCECGE